MTFDYDLYSYILFFYGVLKVSVNSNCDYFFSELLEILPPGDYLSNFCF